MRARAVALTSIFILGIIVVSCRPATVEPAPKATTPPTAQPSSPPREDDAKPIAGWYGRVVGAIPEAQYDDYVVLLPKGTGELGIAAAAETVQAEIDRLRDGELPAHFWGTLVLGASDHGGHQLLVNRIRPEGSGPVVESAVGGWKGVIFSNPPDAQFDDYVQLTGEFPMRYGIISSDAGIAHRLQSLRDTLTPVQIWGTLTCGVADVNGCQLDVTRLVLVGEPLAPTPTSPATEANGEPVQGWEGIIVDLPPGNQFGQLFKRQDGEQFNLGTPTEEVREQVNEARSRRSRVRVWGTLYTGVPASEARTIELERIDVLSQPEDEGTPVEGWTGSIYKLPPGNQFGSRFVRDDGEPYGIGTPDETIRQQINQLAWTGAHISVWGRLYTGVPASDARQIEVDQLEVLSAVAAEPRNLTPFADVSASSKLSADRYGTYGPAAAFDGLKDTAWVEGVPGPGVGEWIELTFPGTIELHALGFDIGYDADADLFSKNNRIKRATLVFSSGEQMSVDFADDRGIQEVAMVPATGPNVKTASIRVIIEEIYAGSAYDDTCLAEVTVWGTVE